MPALSRIVTAQPGPAPSVGASRPPQHHAGSAEHSSIISPLCISAPLRAPAAVVWGMNMRPHIEIDDSFFADLDGVVPQRNTFGCEGKHGWTPAGAMSWYDGIIDDILSNPGTSLTDTAKRLGRSPSTVQAIVRSDMFRARFAQRRSYFEAELDRRIADKLTKVAELSLDAQIETLTKKRDAIPLPILNEVVKTSLDRLGYAPAKPDAGSVSVSINNNVVSPEALASAREKLKMLESKPTLEQAPVAGPEPAGVGEED